MELRYLKDYDRFTAREAIALNEGLEDAGATRINKAFIEHGPIPLTNGEFIEPKEIVRVVREAITERLLYHFGSYFTFVKDFTIIYFWNDPECETMCVDNHMNIYMDALFIYRDLKMDPALVAAVIMHEVFHVVYNHIERGNRWLASQNKSLTRETMYECNLAADVEVNTTLVKKQVVTVDELENEIHGLYLKELGSNIPTMEMILEDDKLMNKLREKCPFRKGGKGGGKKNEDTPMKTTQEFDDAYVEMKNKITDIVNKYGPEKAIDMFREIGAVKGVTPKFNPEFDFEEMFSLNFLRLKSFDDFLNESTETDGMEDMNPFQTKEDGYREAIKQAIKEINSALNQGGIKGGGGGGGLVPETSIDKSRLKPMKLPGKSESGKEDNNQKGGLPTNTVQDSDKGKKDGKKKDDDNTEGYPGPQKDNDNKKDNKEGDPGRNGDGGGSGVDLTGDIKKNGMGNTDVDVTYSEGRKSNGSDKIGDSSIGKTGTFIGNDADNPFGDILKRCYGDKLGDEVKKVIDENRTLNTKEAIEKKKQKLYNSLPDSDFVKKMWDEVKKSEKKFMAMWKKVLKRFLNKKSRRAGMDKEDKTIRWGEKRHKSVGLMAPSYLKKAQEPQDINVYIDVSGSVYSNMELMKLMAESLVSFMNEYKYSGINVIPWASNSTGIHRIDCVSKNGGSARAVTEILECISQGANECGGGTELIGACVPQIVAATFQYERRKKMDDVHVIISDGEVGNDMVGIEDMIKRHINSYKGVSSSSLANTVVKNCIWMIYNDYSQEYLKNDGWEDNIKEGELVRISSRNIRPE